MYVVILQIERKHTCTLLFYKLRDQMSGVVPSMFQILRGWVGWGFVVGSVLPLRLIFKGEGTITFGFQRELPLSKCLIFTLF
jgi:hypothetical protein